MNILPEIRSSSEIYGYLANTCLKGLPISGVRSLVILLNTVSLYMFCIVLILKFKCIFV
jgi:hypothetical protein